MTSYMALCRVFLSLPGYRPKQRRAALGETTHNLMVLYGSAQWWSQPSFVGKKGQGRSFRATHGTVTCAFRSSCSETILIRLSFGHDHRRPCVSICFRGATCSGSSRDWEWSQAFSNRKCSTPYVLHWTRDDGPKPYGWRVNYRK